MNKNIEIMAKTIYGEARGELYKKDGGINALIAVGNVIMNRHLQTKKSIESVCLKPKQFSCWNNDDPNKKAIYNIKSDDKLYEICYKLASDIINGEITDITNGANHYHANYMRPPPYWAIGKTPIKTIGCHTFYKF